MGESPSKLAILTDREASRFAELNARRKECQEELNLINKKLAKFRSDEKKFYDGLKTKYGINGNLVVCVRIPGITNFVLGTREAT